MDTRVKNILNIPLQKIYSNFHHIHPKTGVYYCSYSGWCFEDPFVRESFHFYASVDDGVNIHTTSPLVEVVKFKYGKYRLFDGFSVYLLSIAGKRIF